MFDTERPDYMVVVVTLAVLFVAFGSEVVDEVVTLAVTEAPAGAV